MFTSLQYTDLSGVFPELLERMYGNLSNRKTKNLNHAQAGLVLQYLSLVAHRGTCQVALFLILSCPLHNFQSEILGFKC